MLRLILLFACFVLVSASPADALRCGPRLVTEGAYKPEVLEPPGPGSHGGGWARAGRCMRVP
jgi:hypothetical protein